MTTKTATAASGSATADRVTELSFDFARAVIDNPTLLDDIPSGITLVLLPDDDSAFVEESIEIGIAAVREGKNVYFRHVTRGPNGTLMTPL